MRPADDRIPPLESRRRTTYKEEVLSTMTLDTTRVFVDEAEDRGTIDEAEIEAFAVEHDLEDEDVAALRAELDAREVEILAPAVDEEASEPARPGRPQTTDALA